MVPRSCIAPEPAAPLLVYENLDPDNLTREASPGALWRWDGSTWSVLAEAPTLGEEPEAETPIFRTGPALVYDAARNATVLTSGIGAPIVDTTWIWKDGAWGARQARPPAPSGARSAAAAYDEARGVTVVFGGEAGTFFAETLWEWNGETWRERNVPGGPGPLSLASAAYDPARGGVVVAGGFNTEGTHADVWLFDGEAWQTLPALPAPREAGRLVYDHARAELLFFGGELPGEVSDETWTLTETATAWRNRNVNGCPEGCPAPRVLAQMAYDGSTETVVLLGGVGASGEVTDAWSWDGTAWTPETIDDLPIVTRIGGGMVYDAARARLLLFAGATLDSDGAQNRSDLYERVDGTWRRLVSSEQQPSARRVFVMTYHGATSETLVFGGRAGSVVINDTWTFDGTAWTPRANQPLSPRRCRHSMAYDPSAGHGIMYGGCFDNGCRPGFDTTLVWNASGWAAFQPASRATPPAGFGVLSPTADAGRFVYLPRVEALPHQAWTFDGAVWTPFAEAPLINEVRSTYDRRADRSVFFGGQEADLFAGQLVPSARVFEIDALGELTDFGAVGGPAPRLRHGMAYDEGRGVTVVHGGRNSLQTFAAFRDTWLWDGATWSSGPDGPDRAGHSLAYDPVRDKIVLVAGGDSTGLGRTEVFEYDGAAWRQAELAPGLPQERQSASLTFDTERSALVLHGGDASQESCLDDTWLLSSSRDLRPALRFRLDLRSGGFDLATIRSLTVRTRAGGRGFESTVPGPGSSIPGYQVELWDTWGSEWIRLESSPADVETEGDLTLPVESTETLRRAIRSDGALWLRVTSLAGGGTGSEPATVSLETLEVDVAYGPQEG